MAKAAPLPVLGTLTQSALYWIAMNVAKLLRKLRVVANVEIVVPLLPEMIRIANQTPRYSLLQRLQRIGQSIPLWFAKPDRWPIQARFWLEWGRLLVTDIA